MRSQILSAIKTAALARDLAFGNNIKIGTAVADLVAAFGLEFEVQTKS